MDKNYQSAFVNNCDLRFWRLEILKISLERRINLEGVESYRNWFSAIFYLFKQLGALTIAFILMIFWVTISRKNAPLKTCPRTVIAVHAEVSNRTTHIINTFSVNPSTLDLVVFLGRSRESDYNEVLELLKDKNIAAPHAVPISFLCMLRAIPKIIILFFLTIKDFSLNFCFLGFKDLLAIYFRISIGCVASDWWSHSAVREGTVVYFGITGTADTHLQECSIQQSGARTVHLVHGQASGLNFLSFSDVAVFRSSFDSVMYSNLACYKACVSYAAVKPVPSRGVEALLILSNYAHPMNLDFRKNGLKSELDFVGFVINHFDLMDLPRRKIIWRPHPIFHRLNPEVRSKIVKFCIDNDISLHIENVDLRDLASSSKWIFCTPSTVVIDLFEKGFSPFVVDFYGISDENSLSAVFPIVNNSAQMISLINRYKDDFNYMHRFDMVWSSLGPSVSFGDELKFDEKLRSDYFN